jgi:outer membrane protein assembly factor BamB
VPGMRPVRSRRAMDGLRRLAPPSVGALVVLIAAACGGSEAREPALAAPPELAAAGAWAAPNGDLRGTRASRGSTLRAANVARLRRAWSFRFTGRAGFSGIAAATPLVSGGRVYVQDLNSDVYALDAATGKLLWRHRYGRASGGPNGLALAGGVLYGNTDTSTFALTAQTGSERWRTRLTVRRNPITIAPAVAGGLVFTSTTGQAPGGRGVLVALDAGNGRVRWRFDTIAGPWRFPDARGGGAWQTPTVDAGGSLYVGTANPYPWGGTARRPNGGSYPGPVRWTDSLLVLDMLTGELRWGDQVTAHDVRDHDFQNPPILTRAGGRELVVGAGKAGRVIAWDRETHARVWETKVGLRRNDTGPLPARPVPVCPGLLGGVETPMALARGRLFVPVVDLCFPLSSTGTKPGAFAAVDYAKGTGRMVALDVATGRVVWERLLPKAVFGCATVANDVVFTATYEGRIYALAASDGRTLWSARARAGVNACPAVAGGLLLVAAGTDQPIFPAPARLGLEAFRLPR